MASLILKGMADETPLSQHYKIVKNTETKYKKLIGKILELELIFLSWFFLVFGNMCIRRILIWKHT
jgi:hypothetical protein